MSGDSGGITQVGCYVSCFWPGKYPVGGARVAMVGVGVWLRCRGLLGDAVGGGNVDR